MKAGMLARALTLVLSSCVPLCATSQDVSPVKNRSRTRAKRIFTALLFTSTLLGIPATAQVVENRTVSAPGGQTSFYVENSGAPNERIVECTQQCANKRVVVSATTGGKPEKNLFNFANLQLSPDASVLYFETTAWAVSNAIHAVDLKSNIERFITDGSLACIVPSGTYQGNLLVAQHKYFVQGGSYDPLNLFTPAGKHVGIVALDSSEASKFCAPQNSL